MFGEVGERKWNGDDWDTTMQGIKRMLGKNETLKALADADASCPLLPLLCVLWARNDQWGALFWAAAWAEADEKGACSVFLGEWPELREAVRLGDSVFGAMTMAEVARAEQDGTTIPTGKGDDMRNLMYIAYDEDYVYEILEHVRGAKVRVEGTSEGGVRGVVVRPSGRVALGG